MKQEGEKMLKKPIIGITMGDPAGVGPEITVKALAHQEIYEQCAPMVVGDAEVMRRAAKLVSEEIKIHAVKCVEECRFEYGTIDVLDLGILDGIPFEIGKESAACGEAAFQAVTTVISLAMKKQIDATVTAPLNKAALQMAGHHFSGHTEIYADQTGTQHYTMLLAHGNLRVVHVSTHVSLREACDRCKKARVYEVIRLADRACRAMGIPSPRIGVSGLNPHAGEGGLFGREEIEEIRPAVEQAVEEGICVEGPLPPDSIFPKALSGLYDIVVAMYHDQGHIPIKCAGFTWTPGQKASISGVNITFGLPIIRVSVDHGTAFDIAWKNQADETSMVESIVYAQKIADSEKKDSGRTN